MKKIINVYIAGILVLFFLKSTIAVAGSNEDYKTGNREDVLSQPKDSTDKRSGARPEKDRSGEVSSGSKSGTNPSGTAPAAGSSDSGTGPAYQGRRKSAE